MTYSGADVLAHLSELARQRALMRQITDVIVVAAQSQDGELIQSALRSVIGYDARILISATTSEAGALARRKQPEVVFAIDPSATQPAGAHTVKDLRKAGVVAPIAIISDLLTPRLSVEIVQAGAFDVLHRDDVCGVRLRECLLKLAAPTPPTKD